MNFLLFVDDIALMGKSRQEVEVKLESGRKYKKWRFEC